MTRIPIPADITVTLLDGSPALVDGKPITLSFIDFCRSQLEDQRYGASMVAVVRANTIREALDAANGAVDLDEDLWQSLKAVVENPSRGYDAKVATSLLPFMRAIVDAKNTED